MTIFTALRKPLALLPGSVLITTLSVAAVACAVEDQFDQELSERELVDNDPSEDDLSAKSAPTRASCDETAIQHNTADNQEQESQGQDDDALPLALEVDDRIIDLEFIEHLSDIDVEYVDEPGRPLTTVAKQDYLGFTPEGEEIWFSTTCISSCSNGCSGSGCSPSNGHCNAHSCSGSGSCSSSCQETSTVSVTID
ncbi:MAG: hypothetical protein AAGF11_42680 [Myxococcota bacterium]